MSGESGEPLRRVVMRGLIALRRGLRTALWLTAHALRALLQVLLALLIILEEWGWRPLANVLAVLARWRPWAALETAIARLPPYAALVAFALPSALLLPMKFFALVLIGRGHYLSAMLLFLVAKAVATALVARLFMLTQPALMSIWWFAWGYERLMPWKDALTARVRQSYVWRTGRALKRQAVRAVNPYWAGLQGVGLRAAARVLASMRPIALSARTLMDRLVRRS